MVDGAKNSCIIFQQIHVYNFKKMHYMTFKNMPSVELHYSMNIELKPFIERKSSGFSLYISLIFTENKRYQTSTRNEGKLSLN